MVAVGGMIKSILGALLVVGVASVVGCGSDDSSGGGGTSCKDGCAQTVAANCANGPTQSECESDCGSLESGACKSQFDALRACAASNPVTCDANGDPTITGCDAQESAFVNCLLSGA